MRKFECPGYLKVPHAFSTRIGGISAEPFAALNLGNPSEGPQDSRENIAENYRRLHAAIGCETTPRAWVRQVHGRRVELLEREAEGENHLDDEEVKNSGFLEQ